MLTRNAVAVHQNQKYLWSAIESVHILILLQEANITKFVCKYSRSCCLSNTRHIQIWRHWHLIVLRWTQLYSSLKECAGTKGRREVIVLHPTKSSIENRQMHFVLFCFCLLRASPSHSSITNLINNNNNNNSNKFLYIFHIFDVVVAIVVDPNKRSRKSLNKPIHFIF